MPLAEISAKAGGHELSVPVGPMPPSGVRGPVLAIRQNDMAALPGLASAKGSVAKGDPSVLARGVSGSESLNSGRVLSVPASGAKEVPAEEPSAPGLGGFRLDLGAASGVVPGGKVLEMPGLTSRAPAPPTSPDPVTRDLPKSGESATVLSFPPGASARPSGGARAPAVGPSAALPTVSRGADAGIVGRAGPPVSQPVPARAHPAPSAPAHSDAHAYTESAVSGVSGATHPGVGYVAISNHHSDLSELDNIGLPPLQAHLDALLQSGLLTADAPASRGHAGGPKQKPLGLEGSLSSPVGAVSSGLASSGLASSGLASSGLTSSGLASSGLASSGLTSSGLASSGLASSGLASSGLTVPLEASSGQGDSGSGAQPGAVAEGVHPWAQGGASSAGWGAEASVYAPIAVSESPSSAFPAVPASAFPVLPEGDPAEAVWPLGEPLFPGSNLLEPTPNGPESPEDGLLDAVAPSAVSPSAAPPQPDMPDHEDSEGLQMEGSHAHSELPGADGEAPASQTPSTSPSGAWSSGLEFEARQVEAPPEPTPTPEPVPVKPEGQGAAEEGTVNKDSDPTLLFAGGTVLDLQSWGAAKGKPEPRPAAVRRPSKFPLVHKVPLESEVQTMLDEHLVAPEELPPPYEEEPSDEASDASPPDSEPGGLQEETLLHPPAPFELPSEPEEPEPGPEGSIEALQKRAKELVERQKLYGAVDAAALPKLNRKEQLKLFWETLEPPRQRVPRSALGAVVGGMASSVFILVFLLADALSSVPERPEMPVAERRAEALAQLNRERQQAQAELVRLAESVSEAAGQKKSPPRTQLEQGQTPKAEDSAQTAESMSTPPSSVGKSEPAHAAPEAQVGSGETSGAASGGSPSPLPSSRVPEGEGAKKGSPRQGSAVEAPAVAPRGVRSPRVTSELRTLMKRYQALGLESVRSFEHAHAEEYFRRAMRIADELPDPKAKAELVQELGRTLLVQGELIIHDPVVTLEDCRRAREFFVRARALGYDGQRNRENLRAAERCLRSSSLEP